MYMKFPKIIHQIWLQGKKNIPEKYDSNIESLRHHNLDFEHKIWDEISILEIVHTNPTWTKTYYSLKYLHQKVDYARYIILWLMGGIYVDTDVKALKSFNDILDETYDYDLVVSSININEINSMIQCQYKQCLNNGVIIAKPNADILNEIIKYVDSHNECSNIAPKVMCINKTTGPLMFTKKRMWGR
jgi:mannosyltransferase OCH1-like enzyme